MDDFNRDPFVPGLPGLDRWCAGCGTRSYAEVPVRPMGPAAQSGRDVRADVAVLHGPRGWKIRLGPPDRMVCHSCARGTEPELLKFATEHDVWLDAPQFPGEHPRFTFTKKVTPVPKPARQGRHHDAAKAANDLWALHASADSAPWQQCSANDGKCSCGLVWGAEGPLFSVHKIQDDDGLSPRASHHVNMDVAITARNALPLLIKVVDAALPFRDPLSLSDQHRALRLALDELEAGWRKISPEATTARIAKLNRDAAEFHEHLRSFDINGNQKEVDMALVSGPVPTTPNAPDVQDHRRDVAPPGRLAQHVRPLGGAVLDGLKLATVNETSELVLDAVRRVAKGNALLESALEDPNGRALVLMLAATIIHGVAVESPKLLPKAHLVARVAQKQVEASTFLLVHQNAGLVKSLTTELMEVAKKMVEAEEMHERLTSGEETPKLDTVEASQHEPAPAR